MTEYEVVDALVSVQSEAGRAFMDFVTVLFAYLVVAHFVGASMTRVYTLVVSILYSLFVAFPMAGVTNAASLTIGISNAYSGELTGFGVVTGAVIPSYMPAAVMGLAWVISLAYMYRVRTNAAA